MIRLRVVKEIAAKGLAGIALLLAWVLSFLFYFLVIGPYAIVMRVAFGDLLEKKPDPRQKSYWHKLDPERPRPDKPF